MGSPGFSLREMPATHKDLARKLDEMEKKYDAQFKVVFDAICQLITPSQKPGQYLQESICSCVSFA